MLGLYNAFTKHPPNPLSWVAAGLFALSVVVSVALSGLSPYRRMRAAVLQENADWRRPGLAGAADERLPETVLDKEAWLRKRIALERRLYGKAESSAALWRIRWVGQPENLQEAFERERYGVLAVQLLVVAEVVLLFLATTL